MSNISMESAKAPTTPSMLKMLMPPLLPPLLPLLLLLWSLLCVAALGSSLPERELQMLEMMRNILGVDTSHLAARSQRNSMSYAPSLPYQEDSLPEEAGDGGMSIFDEDLDDSEECNDYGCPIKLGPMPTPDLPPCPHPLVPMDHPCFVRVIVLRTPLFRHDPCQNFTLTTSSSSTSTTTTTTKPTPARKCRPKQKATPSTTTQATTSDESEMETIEDSSTEESTTSERSSSTTTTEEPSTTTELSTTTPATTNPTTTTPTTTPTTTTTTTTTTTPKPSSTTIVYSRQSQLKSLRGRRRKPKRKPSVPDTPKIKLDGAMQSSDTYEVFQTTEASDIRLRPEATMPAACEPETTPAPSPAPAPADCVEDDDEKSKAKANERVNEAGDSTAGVEDCEDTEDQATKLCPQFSNPDDDGVPANMRLVSSSRNRKPHKNYVEPILYEGQFAKPRHSNGLIPAQRRDYYVSNKQIMPRPKPRYREPLPHSIYMNNIVRGIKCNDEVSNLRYPLLPRRYRAGTAGTGGTVGTAGSGVGPVGPGGGNRPHGVWISRHQAPGEYTAMGAQRQAHGNLRARSNSPYRGLSSAEDPDSYGVDSSDPYYDDGSGEFVPLSWSREKLGLGTLPNADPCAAEHRQERARERERERNGDRENDHMMENVEPRYFT